MSKRKKPIRIDDEILEVLKIKKGLYRTIYGKRIRSYNDVLKVDFGLKYPKGRRRK